MSQMATELMSSALPLFMPTPNGREQHGESQNKMMPRPSSSGAWHLRLYKFVGMLLGIAFRTKRPLALNFSGLMWKRMVGEAITLADLRDADESFASVLAAVAACPSAESFAHELTFSCLDSEGVPADLCPGGATKAVTYDNRLEFVELALQQRASECDAQIQMMRVGFGQLVPTFVLGLLTGMNLEYDVCGAPEIDIDLLEQTTEYETLSRQSPEVERFWNVLRNEFTPDERVAFLRYVSGRTRLPTTVQQLEPRNCHLQLTRMRSAAPDRELPIAHTCFFSLELPAFSSEEILAQRLRLVITHSFAIQDTDRVDRSAFEGL